MNLRIRSLSDGDPTRNKVLRGQTKEEYILYDFLYSNSGKRNIIYGNRN